MLEGVWRHSRHCSKRSSTANCFTTLNSNKQELNTVFLSHLENEVFYRHAKHYYYYYHSYHCLKSSLILGDKSPFQCKGLKTFQLFLLELKWMFQPHVRSMSEVPEQPKLPVTGSIN